MPEPNLRFRFGVQAKLKIFEPEPNLNLNVSIKTKIAALTGEIWVSYGHICGHSPFQSAFVPFKNIIKLQVTEMP